MPISNYFDIVWAVDGDVTPIPDALDPSGFVSFDQGYTANYTSPSGTYPIEREKFNYLMNQVTLAIQTYQQFGTPPFITTTMNGGTPFSYSKFARVLSGGIVYTSLSDANIDTPPSANWTTGNDVPAGGTGLNVLTAHNILIGNGASPITLLPPSAAAGIPLVSKGASLDPAYDTVAIAGGGTAATTAAGARTNLGLAPYISSPQAITTSGTLTLAHGFSAAPSFIQLKLICTTIDNGWAVNDTIEVNFGYANGNTSRSAAVYSDSTNVYVLFGNSAPSFQYINKSTRGEADLTNSSWQLIVIARQ